MPSLSPSPSTAKLVSDNAQADSLWKRWLDNLKDNLKASQDAIAALETANVVEPWRNVGDSGEPAFLNSWVNFSAGYEVASFYKDPFDVVHIRGLVKSGTINTTIFILPTGYRPANKLLFAAIDGLNSAVRLEVASDGSVVAPASTSTAFQSITCSFRV